MKGFEKGSIGSWVIAIGITLCVGYFFAVIVAQAFPGGLDWGPITGFTMG